MKVTHWVDERRSLARGHSKHYQNKKVAANGGGNVVRASGALFSTAHYRGTISLERKEGAPTNGPDQEKRSGYLSGLQTNNE